MEPMIEERAEQAYAGITEKATLAEWGRVNALVPEVLAWLTEQGHAPAGPPLYRYYAGEPGGELEVEVGWPVSPGVLSSDRVRVATLPAGRYAVLVHRGHPDSIGTSFAALEAWSERTGEHWDRPGGRWVCRYESYRTNPQEEPDPAKWETEICYKLAD